MSNNEDQYFYTDEESGEYKIGGKPTDQEAAIGRQMAQKADKKVHDY